MELKYKHRLHFIIICSYHIYIIIIITHDLSHHFLTDQWVNHIFRIVNAALEIFVRINLLLSVFIAHSKNTDHLLCRINDKFKDLLLTDNEEDAVALVVSQAGNLIIIIFQSLHVSIVGGGVHIQLL